MRLLSLTVIPKPSKKGPQGAKREDKRDTKAQTDNEQANPASMSYRVEATPEPKPILRKPLEHICGYPTKNACN